MLEAPVPLVPDSPLQLHLVVGGERTDLDARVRGCVQRGIGAPHRVGSVGVQFETVDPVSRERLERAWASARGPGAGPELRSGLGSRPVRGPAGPRGGDRRAARRLEDRVPRRGDPRRARARAPRRPAAARASRSRSAGVAGQARRARPRVLPSSSATSTRSTTSAGSSAWCCEVGDDRRPSLREHAQERRRGLAGARVAQVGHDVRRLDVRRQLGERHASGHDVRPRTPSRVEVGVEPRAVGDRADQQQSQPGVRAARAARRRAPRSRTRFSGVSRPKTADHDRRSRRGRAARAARARRPRRPRAGSPASAPAARRRPAPPARTASAMKRLCTATAREASTGIRNSG